MKGVPPMSCSVVWIRKCGVKSMSLCALELQLLIITHLLIFPFLFSAENYQKIVNYILIIIHYTPVSCLKQVFKGQS